MDALPARGELLCEPPRGVGGQAAGSAPSTAQTAHMLTVGEPGLPVKAKVVDVARPPVEYCRSREAHGTAALRSVHLDSLRRGSQPAPAPDGAGPRWPAGGRRHLRGESSSRGTKRSRGRACQPGILWADVLVPDLFAAAAIDVADAEEIPVAVNDSAPGRHQGFRGTVSALDPPRTAISATRTAPE